MSGSQACRDSPHGPIENVSFEGREKLIKSFWMFTEPDTISLFRLLMHMYFLFILLPHFVLIMYVPMFQSYNDNIFCGWTSSWCLI